MIHQGPCTDQDIGAALPLFANARPAATALARPVCSLVVDAEEDFDWDNPTRGVAYSTDCMRRIPDLQALVGPYGVRPTYLLTYPILEDPAVMCLLQRQLDRGECDVGVQLHPWVNPPFDAESSSRMSFLGNLPTGMEERKLVALKDKFQQRFGRPPRVFRAGRYGLGKETSRLLEAHGFAIDTSLAPRTSFAGEGGPDFSGYDCGPFWFGTARDMLEVPLCRSVVGWGSRFAPSLYHMLSAPLPSRLRASAVLSRSRCAERITLSPEGNDEAAMRRFLCARLAHGQSVYSLSFHSSSLAIGRNFYVRTRADLHAFYDRLSAILDTMASGLGFCFATLAEMPVLLGGAAP